MKMFDIQSVMLGGQERFAKHFSGGPKRDKGQLFFTIELLDNPGAEDALVDKIWRALHDTYFNCTADDHYLCFEEALKKVNETLEKEKAKRENGTLGQVNSLAALIIDGVLHLAKTGTASVYLHRGGHLSPVMTPEAGEDQSLFSDVLTGELSHADVAIFSTRALAVENQEIHDVLFEQPKELLNDIKGLVKKHDLDGMISAFRYEEFSYEPPSEPEYVAPVVAPPPEEIVDSEELGKPRKFSSPKVLKSFAKHLNKEKLSSARKTMQGVFSGVGARVKRIAGHPTLLKEVNRRYILLGLILAVFTFGIVVLYQSGYQEEQQKAQLYETLISQVRNNISIAEQRFLIGQRKDATDFLNKASTSLDEIEVAGYFASDVQKLRNEVSLYRDNFDALIRVKSANTLADLSTKGSADALGFIHTEDDKNVVFEPKRIFETFLDKVQDPLNIDVLETNDLVIATAELEDFKSLVFITQGGQVLEYLMRNGTFQQMNTLDTTWKKGVDVKSFHGEYIYLLDSANNTIWRYQRLRTSFGVPVSWTTAGDMSDAVSMAIDGDVYLLTRKGEILRYRKGELTPFTITDQPTVPLSTPTKIFTFAEATNLYVLDSENKRIVVYSKGIGDVGKYEKQIVFEDLAANEIRDFSVDKDEQKLTILTTDKLIITDL